jgi:hypothetical protein
MRTAAVIAVGGARDARHAASRLTRPVSDETARAGTMTAVLDRGGRQLTPALLGGG